jgi:uncharacterized membrane protein YfcA
MLLFALLMVAASWSMIRYRAETHTQARQNIALQFAAGIGIGLITGFLGAGGGFLLIPALVLLLNLPMKKAIGTSLFIIAVNSLVGFVADIGLHVIDYRLLATIIVIAIAGVITGTKLNQRIDARALKTGFGWFVLAMGCFIIVKELLLLK